MGDETSAQMSFDENAKRTKITVKVFYFNCLGGTVSCGELGSWRYSDGALLECQIQNAQGSIAAILSVKVHISFVRVQSSSG